MSIISLRGTVAGRQVPDHAINRGRRRLDLLRRTGLFQPNLTGAVVSRAATLGERLEALRVVHEVFVERRYIRPCPCGIRIRPYDAMPETGTFVAKAGGRIVGVDGLVLDSEGLGLPCDAVFAAEIEPLRMRNRLIVEATNKAVLPDWRRTAVPTELTRCCFAYALSLGADDLVAAVGPGHASFYEMLGFEQIGPVRNYSSQTVDPVVLIRMDLRTYVDHLSAQPQGEAVLSYHVWENPYRAELAGWAAVADRFFEDPSALRELFVTRTALLDRCTPRELAAIRRRWGEPTFARVLSAGSTSCAAP